MDLKKDNLNINPAMFRLRGTHNGVKIGTDEIVLLTYIVFLQNNNRAKNGKDYCSASNAALADYLYFPQGTASNRKIQRMLETLEKAGFISRAGKAPRKIYVHYNFICGLIEDRLNAEPTIDEKKEASSQQTRKRLDKQDSFKITRLELDEKQAPTTKPKESVEKIIKERWNSNAPEENNIEQCQIWLDYALSGEEIMEIAYNLGLRSYKPNKKIYTDPEYGFEEMDGEDCPF